MEATIEIIDVQINEFRPWLNAELSPVDRNRLVLEVTLAAMDSAGVDAAILVTRPDMIEFAATHFPDRFAGVMRTIDPSAPDLTDQIADLRKRPGMLGVRVLITWPPTGENVELLKAGEFEPIFSAAEKHGVPISIFVSGDLPLAGHIASGHPDLSLIIDNFGLSQPPASEGDFSFRHLQDLLNLARYPNVSVKFSGAPTLSMKPYPFKDLWPHLHRVLGAFGPQRLMWGSDITRVTGRTAGPYAEPTVRPDKFSYVGKHTYAEAVGFLMYTDEVSKTDKELMFGVTARRIWKWSDGGGR